MVLIYGVKTVTLDDILDGVLRPDDILKYANERIDFIMKEVGDCSITMESPASMGPRYLKFVFIPVEIIRTLMEDDRLFEHWNNIYNTLSSKGKLNEIAGVIDKMKELAFELDNELDELVDDYNKNNKILDSICLLAIYNSSDKIVDLCVASPSFINNKFHQEITYNCCKCNASVVVNGFSEFIPDDMMYDISNNEVNYYCLECAKKENISTYVGDSLNH